MESKQDGNSFFELNNNNKHFQNVFSKNHTKIPTDIVVPRYQNSQTFSNDLLHTVYIMALLQILVLRLKHTSILHDTDLIIF
jgi:hypothetical protein